MKTVLVLDGPSLDRLGTREPGIYGRVTREEVGRRLHRLGSELGLAVITFQSNHEGALIDRIWAAVDEGVAGLVVNAGGYSHSSVALRDALSGSGLPFVEVHVSNVAAREPFRHASLLAPVAAGVIFGFGIAGYELALRGLAGAVSGSPDGGALVDSGV